jgi:hypothetical protein
MMNRTMVGRMILATLSGALVYFVWVMLAWKVLPLHDWTIRNFSDESRARAFFQSATRHHAVYRIPLVVGSYDVRDPRKVMGDSMRKAEAAKGGSTDSPSPPKSDHDFLLDRMREGPILFVACDPDGSDPADWRLFLCGAVLDVAAAFIATLVVALAAPALTSYASRVLMVAALGLFVTLVAHLPYWNWMHFPLDYSIMMGVDSTVGWGLAGLAIGAIVEHRAEQPSKPPVA